MRGKDSSSGDMLRHTNDIQRWFSSDGVDVRLLVTNVKSFMPVSSTAQTYSIYSLSLDDINAVIILMILHSTCLSDGSIMLHRGQI